MNRAVIYFIALFGVFQSVFAQQEAVLPNGKKVILWEDGSWVYADSIPLYNLKASSLSRLEIPKTSSKDIVITHTGFSLLYNEAHEQASWIAYELTKDETNKIFERTDKFVIDPKVKSGTATDKDYSNSGYDRGHLAPASDMGWSETSMAESFYYSNMSPQAPSFNRGVWKRLEENVRRWAIENNGVYIVTGPVLTSAYPAIGPNKVSIPEYFYKVILDYSEPSIKGIGFILPNSGSTEELQKFAVSIDSVETFSGIDFFPSLPDEQEKIIENTLCLKCWTWDGAKVNSKKESEKSPESVQCKGRTKVGDRCQNKTLNRSGYCHLHESQKESDPDVQTQPKRTESRPTVQCTGTTKAGNRCKHMTSSPNGRCYQHGGN